MAIIIPFSLGIVGHAEDKFTSETTLSAKQAIHSLISKYRPTRIISGGCHLGGIDSYAEEIANSLSITTTIYRPKSLSWSEGYKPRNLLIAQNSTLLACIVVRDYPSHYTGMRFSSCYHCCSRNPPHVKSGGCWTTWKCQRREWVII